MRKKEGGSAAKSFAAGVAPRTFQVLRCELEGSESRDRARSVSKCDDGSLPVDARHPVS